MSNHHHQHQQTASADVVADEQAAINGTVLKGKNKRVKRYLILFLVNLYLLQASCFIMLAEVTWGVALFAVFSLSAAILMSLNLVSAVGGVRILRDNTAEQMTLSRRILLFKIFAIPFYLLHLVICTLAASVTIIVPMFRYLALILPLLGIFLSYLVLLAGSAQAISLLVCLHEDGRISRNQMTLHIILQLLFVIDVIDYFILFSNMRRLLCCDHPAPMAEALIERKQPLGKYGYGLMAGFWMIAGDMVLLSNKIPLLNTTAVKWIWAFIMVAVCGQILSMANLLNRNLLITTGVTVFGWCTLVFTDLGNLLNHGFGNTGGYLPGQAAYLFGGVLLIPILLFSYLAARFILRGSICSSMINSRKNIV